MKLSNLKYFVDVAMEGSFTRASEKLFISQPTLSRRIKELETELGVELFIRNRHSLELSSAGQQFLIEVNDILNRVNKLSHMFDNQKTADEAGQLLKMGYLSNFNMNAMYELLESFKQSHPHVQFSLKPDTPMNLAEGLSNGQYDLVFNLSAYFQPNMSIEEVLFIKKSFANCYTRGPSIPEKEKSIF